MNAVLWDVEAMARAAGATVDGAPAGPILSFSIDTRSLATGDVFVALKDVRDGHDFVDAAFKAGAAAALVENGYQRQPGDGALLRVADTLEGLKGVARAARARLAPDARVIAVTGSAGKTTTKEMLRVCLEAVAPGRVHASIKSYNNHWGVPLMLASMPAGTRFGVFEIGMNHAGEIVPLTRLVRPHVAVVTNVLPVHVGNFADGEAGVAEAKAEIFAGLEAGGVAVIPASGAHTDMLRRAAEKDGARVRTFNYEPDPDADISIRLGTLGYPDETPSYTAQRREGGELRFKLGVRGEHVATDALAALLAIEACGVDPVTASGGLASMNAPPGRGDRSELQVGGISVLLIDESYNANPASMVAAIRTAAVAKRDDEGWTRLVLVLGEMLELGAQSRQRHESLVDDVRAAAQFGASTVFACGPNMKHLFEALPPELRGDWKETAAALEPVVLDSVRGGDIVMVKGSNGARTWAIVAALKKRFALAEGGR